MDNPKVSIVVPIYNVAQYIKKCAHSLFAQSLEDIEYIFVDDCSPDNSIELLNQVLLSYPQRKDEKSCNDGYIYVRKHKSIKRKR